MRSNAVPLLIFQTVLKFSCLFCWRDVRCRISWFIASACRSVSLFLTRGRAKLIPEKALEVSGLSPSFWWSLDRLLSNWLVIKPLFLSRLGIRKESSAFRKCIKKYLVNWGRGKAKSDATGSLVCYMSLFFYKIDELNCGSDALQIKRFSKCFFLRYIWR